MKSPLPRAEHWVLPRDLVTFDNFPRLMGIVNVTPDSFSDGGVYFDPGRAVEHALQLAGDGADLLDIGGESTRPYSSPVPAEEELRRVVPVIEAVCRQSNVPVSVDTSKAVVAEAAMDAGAQIVNDITGLEGDPAMVEIVVRTGAAVCAMHMQGTPQTMQDRPTYRDVVSEIFEYLRLRRDRLNDLGIPIGRICLDPGIGFGKTHEHNLTLLRSVFRFLDLGCPILIGHSRKGFIAKQIGDQQADRDPGTIGVALALARRRMHILRVHNVRAVHQAIQLFAAAGGLDEGLTAKE
jgi:dihydropteroate synthase